MYTKIVSVILSFLFLGVTLDLTIAASMNYGIYPILAFGAYIIFWLIPIIYLNKKGKEMNYLLLLILILLNIFISLLVEYGAQSYGKIKKDEAIERMQYYQKMRDNDTLKAN